MFNFQSNIQIFTNRTFHNFLVIMLLVVMFTFAGLTFISSISHTKVRNTQRDIENFTKTLVAYGQKNGGMWAGTADGYKELVEDMIVQKRLDAKDNVNIDPKSFKWFYEIEGRRVSLANAHAEKQPQRGSKFCVQSSITVILFDGKEKREVPIESAKLCGMVTQYLKTTQDTNTDTVDDSFRREQAF